MDALTSLDSPAELLLQEISVSSKSTSTRYSIYKPKNLENTSLFFDQTCRVYGHYRNCDSERVLVLNDCFASRCRFSI